MKAELATHLKHNARICFLLAAFAGAISFLGLRSSGAQTRNEIDRVATTSEVEVTGEVLPGALAQDAPVGPYGQPEWTTGRIFGASRIYVLPPGRVELIHLWTPKLSDRNIAHTFREEVEIGLPYRFQLDFYQNWGVDEDAKSFYKGSSVELRYALANWGRMPLNPTLYAEWYFNDRAADAYELKLLLGETLAHRWNWACNFTFEQETGGERETEIAASTALTYPLIDQKLNVGVEAFVEHVTAKDSRHDAEIEFLIGPTVNVHPTRHSFITVSPLFGTTKDSPTAEIFVAAGFQFEFGGSGGPSQEGPRAPASMFGR